MTYVSNPTFIPPFQTDPSLFPLYLILPQTRGVFGYIPLSNTTFSQGYIGIGRWDEED